MSLSDEERRKIAEQEEYRAKIREQEQYRESISPLTKPKHSLVARLFIILLLMSPFLFIYFAVKSNPAEQLTKIQSEKAESLPAMSLVGLTESQVIEKYKQLISDYSEGTLTPSKKIRITGFDIPLGNVQIDYKNSDDTVYYVGYSFSEKPVYESVAWKIVGINKPTAIPETNPGIMNREVVYWQNLPEIQPYGMLLVIYESDGKVGKIALSIEDATTAQSSKSLYYVPIP